MRITLKLTILIVLVAAGAFFLSQQTQTLSDIAGVSVVNEDISYEVDVEQGVKLAYVRNHQLKYVYEPNNKLTVRKLAESKGFSLAVNGAYFSGNYTQATHAGLLYQNGQTITKQSNSDPQITHVVSMLNNKLEFIANRDFRLNKDTQLAFQTGPLVIENNRITQDYIDQSTNGKGEYKRTLLGKTSQGDLFFVVTNQPYTLTDLASWLLSNEKLKSQTFSAINLDGGSSSAMYSKDYTDLNFNTSWFLPILVGV